jgi:uncharacterized membrane protein
MYGVQLYRLDLRNYPHIGGAGTFRRHGCPIYGFCTMALVLILGKLNSVPLTFVLGTFITTAAELAAPYMLDLFIDHIWDCDVWAFSFQGRIALGSSLIFGACAYC